MNGGWIGRSVVASVQLNGAHTPSAASAKWSACFHDDQSGNHGDEQASSLRKAVGIEITTTDNLLFAHVYSASNQDHGPICDSTYPLDTDASAAHDASAPGYGVASLTYTINYLPTISFEKEVDNPTCE